MRGRIDTDDAGNRADLLENHVTVPDAIGIQADGPVGVESAHDLALVAEHDVLAVVAVNRVAAEPADDLVVAAAAEDRVVAALAEEAVVAVVAEDRVVARNQIHVVERDHRVRMTTPA